MNGEKNNKTNAHEEASRKNARLGLTILAVVFGMVGMSYAFVPLYNLFCSVTGFGGTTQVSEQFPDEIIDRTITVKFNAETNHNLPWEFGPEQREIKVKLGQRGLASFYSQNKSAKPVTGMAVYNVTPLKVGQYFHKVQCFCFNEQTLGPKERVSMPVLLYIDPAFNDDPAMDDVDTVTLSYTFFNANSETLDEDLGALYNQEQPAIQQGANTN